MKGTEVKDLERFSSGAHKARTPVTVFGTYLKQRFGIATFATLALYVLLFGLGHLQFNVTDVLSFGIILLFLLTMRLYDDLQNITFDENKPERIYTDPLAANVLYIFLGIAGVTLLALMSVFALASVPTCIAFLAVNHILYVLLVNRSGWRFFLPLIKYPFIAGLIASNWSVANLSLFFAFLTVDLIDDPDFPLPRWSAVITSLASFVLLAPSTQTSGHVFVAALAIGASGLALIRSKYVAYVFLVLLLAARLTNSLYEL